jgi:RNA polymerase sigma-70 factor, ECF subfamily
MGEVDRRLSLVPSAEPGSEAVPLVSRSDDELMLLARGGARGAFDTLVRRHQTRVLHVAARRLGGSAAAADAAQNAFLEIYRALPRYQARGIFAAYLYKVLLNQCRATARSRRFEGQLDAPLPEATPSAEGEILARERQRDVDAAVGRLGDKLRDVVLLRYGAGLAYEEIAASLGVPIGTVKRRLFDAMERLRQSLEGQ